MDIRQCEALSWRLGGALVALVLAFDLLSIFLPGIAGREMASGIGISIGVAFAFFIVGAVIVTAVYYVRRLNIEDPATQSRIGAETDR